MNYQELPRISEQVVSIPLPDFAPHIDFNAPENTNIILLEILAELKSIRYRLDGELYVSVNNTEDFR